MYLAQGAQRLNSGNGFKSMYSEPRPQGLQAAHFQGRGPSFSQDEFCFCFNLKQMYISLLFCETFPCRVFLHLDSEYFTQDWKLLD